jgi:hypothetical protein
MKIVVTGGAGFIGSHVADLFLAQGHEVIVLDDLSSGSLENLDPRARFEQLDIRSPEAAALIEREKPQAITHMAAQMDVRRSVADPRFDADVNIGGFLNLLEAAVRAGTRRVLFSSTGGAIYGEQDQFPAPESHPQRPCSPYGVSKAAGEIYLNYYHQQHGLSYAAPLSVCSRRPDRNVSCIWQRRRGYVIPSKTRAPISNQTLSVSRTSSKLAATVNLSTSCMPRRVPCTARTRICRFRSTTTSIIPCPCMRRRRRPTN